MMEPGEGEEGSEEEGSEDENDIQMAEVDSNGAPVGKVTADGKPVSTQARRLRQRRIRTANYYSSSSRRKTMANSPKHAMPQRTRRWFSKAVRGCPGLALTFMAR